MRPQLVEQKMEEITRKAAANRQEKKPLTPEQVAAKDARLDVQVARVNSKLDPSLQLDASRVKGIARERRYDNVFYASLGQIERNAEKGNHTPGPYDYLTTGRVSQLPKLRMDGGLSRNAGATGFQPRNEKAPEIHGGSHEAIGRSIKKLGTAMAPQGRTQDVRSDAEKEQDREIER